MVLVALQETKLEVKGFKVKFFYILVREPAKEIDFLAFFRYW